MDPAKLSELRTACIRNAAEINKEYQQARLTDRRFFYDSQTSILQCPVKRPKLETQNRDSTASLYPVALHPLQYNEHYKRLERLTSFFLYWIYFNFSFTPAELRRLPFGTIMDAEHLFVPRREASPPPIRVTDEEIARQTRVFAALERSRPVERWRFCEKRAKLCSSHICRKQIRQQQHQAAAAVAAVEALKRLERVADLHAEASQRKT